MATSLASRPSGKITAVMKISAEREGAFRFVENERIDPRAIGRASHEATARRSIGRQELIVPVDQTSLTLTDRFGKPGFGRTGPSAGSANTGGFQVMSAVAVGADGRFEGLLAQEWSARLEKSPPNGKGDKRPLAQRESALWGRAIDSAEAAAVKAGFAGTMWFQLDRGGDCQAVLEGAVDSGRLITVRSAHDRALEGGGRLHRFMQRQKCLGSFRLRIPAGTSSRSRTVSLSVRSARTTLRLRNINGNNHRALDIWCIQVSERCNRADRIQWWLLTTVASPSFDKARKVITNYTLRWRIEEFHRAWKSGVCSVEDSQLRSADTFRRWATISAAVAARAERLKTLARATPEVSALAELSRDEIDAAIVVSETRRFRPGDELTLAQAVRLIADTGGYTGKSSGGPPGARVIQRGLDQVLVAAKALKLLRGRSKK